MTMSVERNEHDLELLSAYIDGQLADLERAALETRLQNEPALRQQLAELRATIGLIRDLPLMAAPRNFMLTPVMVRPQTRPRTTTTYLFSFVSAAAALLLFIAGFGLLSTSRQAGQQSSAANTTLREATLVQDIAAVPTGIAATPTDQPLVLEFAVSSSEEAAGARAFSEPDTEAADTFLAPQGTPSDDQAGEPEMQMNAASEADSSPSPQIQSYSVTEGSAESSADAQITAAQEAAPEETGINSIAIVPPSAAEITALATETAVVPEAFAGGMAEETELSTIAGQPNQPLPTASPVAQGTRMAAATMAPSVTTAPSVTMAATATTTPTETPLPLPTFIPISAEQPEAPPANEAPIGVLMIVGALVLLVLAAYAFFSSRLR